MKRLLLLALILSASAAMGQTLSYIPERVAVYTSSTGVSGSWHPAVATTGTTISFVPEILLSFCSGSGASGSWAACSGFTAGSATLAGAPRPATAVYVGAVGSVKSMAGTNGATIAGLPRGVSAYCSSDGTGAAGTWAPCGYTQGSNSLGYNPKKVALYCSIGGTGAAGTWAPCPSSFAPPLNPCLISGWPMNDGSGTTYADVSTNANTATLSASSAITWQANGGFPGITPFWNGTGYATAASSSIGNFTNTQPFSVAFWQSIGGGFNEEFISTRGSQGWDITNNATSNELNVYLINSYPSNYIEVGSTTATSDGTKHFIVVTVDGSSKAAGVKIYKDGTLLTNTVFSDTLTATIAGGNPLTLGSFVGGGANFLAGPMNNMAVYNCALTPTQIATYSSNGPKIN